MMQVSHGDHKHEVQLLDDGTLDTVVAIDGHEVRFMSDEVIRDREGGVVVRWLREQVREACNDSLLED